MQCWHFIGMYHLNFWDFHGEPAPQLHTTRGLIKIHKPTSWPTGWPAYTWPNLPARIFLVVLGRFGVDFSHSRWESQSKCNEVSGHALHTTLLNCWTVWSHVIAALHRIYINLFHTIVCYFGSVVAFIDDHIMGDHEPTNMAFAGEKRQAHSVANDWN